ncbi:hypothetical protein CMI47_17810 [Candidatus Pacearchaeota archaeon]|nr:hypothetical protein [Candidatus Pacearchaeota archaeon]
MSRTHIALEDLFQGEEASEVISALDESIGRAVTDECRLVIEGRAEPDETRRSSQQFTVELDPGSDPPPHAESVLAELQRNYEEALGLGFTGTVRMNFKGKGRNVTYRSLQRKVIIEGPEEEEEEDVWDEEEEEGPPRYGRRGRRDHFRPVRTANPRLDLSREDDDEFYVDDHAPPGTISPGRVRGLSTTQGEYIFLPHFEAIVNVGERRNDRVLKALMEQQTIQAQITTTLLENQRELNEQMLGMMGTKALRAQREADKPADNKMASWLGGMLVKGVMDKVKQGSPGGSQGGGNQNRGGQSRQAVPEVAEDYDPYDNPTFTVPSAHSSEFEDDEPAWEPDEFQAPVVRSPRSPAPSTGGNGPLSGNDIMDEIARLRENDPDAFAKTIQERGEELLPAVLEAMSD